MAIFNHPFPLLDNLIGNFKESRFDCELIKDELINGKFHWEFEANITDSVLINLIKEGSVTFAVKVQCSPIFTKTFTAKENKNKVEITVDYKEVPADFNFNFTPIIISLKEFDYKNENVEPPMNEYSFKVSKFQILGSHVSQRIKYDQGYKSFDTGPLVKLVRLPKGVKPSSGDFDIDLSQNFNVLVKVAEETFNALKELNITDSKVLDNLLLLPILQFIIQDLNNSTNNRDREWAIRLDDEFDIFGLESTQDILKKCNDVKGETLLEFSNHFNTKYDV